MCVRVCVCAFVRKVKLQCLWRVKFNSRFKSLGNNNKNFWRRKSFLVFSEWMCGYIFTESHLTNSFICENSSHKKRMRWKKTFIIWCELTRRFAWALIFFSFHKYEMRKKIKIFCIRNCIVMTSVYLSLCYIKKIVIMFKKKCCVGRHKIYLEKLQKFNNKYVTEKVIFSHMLYFSHF